MTVEPIGRFLITIWLIACVTATAIGVAKALQSPRLTGLGSWAVFGGMILAEWAWTGFFFVITYFAILSVLQWVSASLR